MLKNQFDWLKKLFERLKFKTCFVSVYNFLQIDSLIDRLNEVLIVIISKFKEIAKIKIHLKIGRRLIK